MAGAAKSFILAFMINFKRLDHVQLCFAPGKLEDARRFYTEVIGLQQIDRPQEFSGSQGIWFQLSNMQLHLGMEPENGVSNRHPAFEVTDLAAAREHLERHGIAIIEELQVPGQRRFSFVDPFNNRIELLEWERKNSD